MKTFRTPRAAAVLLALAAPGLAGGAGAVQAAELSGRVALTYGSVTTAADSLSAMFGPVSHARFLGNARLQWQHSWGNVSVEIHDRLAVEIGPGVAIDNGLAALMPPAPPGNYLNLDRSFTDASGRRITQTIDRLSLGFSSPSLVVKLGRQTLTWGSGQTFHPMDLMAPFSPAATDTEFKPGVDMLYLQWLMKNGDDLELIAVPRRATAGGPATAQASTFGARYRGTPGAVSVEAILARDHGDSTAGIGLSGALGGAAWNAELVPTRLAGGQMRVSGLANISTAVDLAGHSAVISAEYFHNGFGLPGSGGALASLPPELRTRLARGQLFTLFRDYLALGASVELSPLTTLRAGGIVNLADNSSLSTLALDWSLSDNTSLILGGQFPAGRRGTEFGGLPLSGGGAPYAVPETSVYIQFRHYF